jgi:hypothetical protein
MQSSALQNIGLINSKSRVAEVFSKRVFKPLSITPTLMFVFFLVKKERKSLKEASNAGRSLDSILSFTIFFWALNFLIRSGE